MILPVASFVATRTAFYVHYKAHLREEDQDSFTVSAFRKGTYDEHPRYKRFDPDSRGATFVTSFVFVRIGIRHHHHVEFACKMVLSVFAPACRTNVRPTPLRTYWRIRAACKVGTFTSVRKIPLVNG